MPLVSLPENGVLCPEGGPLNPIYGGLNRQRRPQPGDHVSLTCGQIKPRSSGGGDEKKKKSPFTSEPVIHGAAPFLTSPTGAVNVLPTERGSSPGEPEPFISLKDPTLCFGGALVVLCLFPSVTMKLLIPLRQGRCKDGRRRALSQVTCSQRSW